MYLLQVCLRYHSLCQPIFLAHPMQPPINWCHHMVIATDMASLVKRPSKHNLLLTPLLLLQRFLSRLCSSMVDMMLEPVLMDYLHKSCLLLLLAMLLTPHRWQLCRAKM